MRYEAGLAHLEIGKRLDEKEHLLAAEKIFADIGAALDLQQTLEQLCRLAGPGG